MKTSISIFMLLLAPYIVLIGQTQYTVVEVDGKVMNLRNHELLKERSTFLEKDELQFYNTQQLMAVIDEKQQSFLIKPEANLKQYKRLEWLRAVGDRDELKEWAGLVNFIHGSKIILPPDGLALEVGGKEFLLGQDQFFFIRYDLEGEDETINKKLPFQGNYIFINRSALFRVDGKPIDPALASNFILYYRTESGYLKIGHFGIVLQD